MLLSSTSLCADGGSAFQARGNVGRAPVYIQVVAATDAELIRRRVVQASADKQPVTVGALAFVTASGIQYGQIAAAIVLSVTPTLLLALYAQRYLVEGLSLGAVKG